MTFAYPLMIAVDTDQPKKASFAEVHSDLLQIALERASVRGGAGLINAKPIPKNPANQTPPEIVDKVLYRRSKYHLGSIRIVWYLARYHGITISDAGVTRILRRNGVGRPHRTVPPFLWAQT